MARQFFASRRNHDRDRIGRRLVTDIPWPRTFARTVERVVWGGERRERLLIKLLQGYYASLFRRQWRLAAEPPHYFDHRIDSFAFAIGTEHPYGLYRGFFATEVIRGGATLLDIGCGDGFFARRFFAPRCAHVDAIDVDVSAITHASRFNGAPNISYSVLDAVDQPFPRDRYDVIVLDGALGHFAPDTTRRLLRKIRDALADDGVFVGSESLGQEGHDHLQFFETLDDLASVLGDNFGHIRLRSIDYTIPSGIDRHEAFWQCAAEEARLQEAAWYRPLGVGLLADDGERR